MIEKRFVLIMFFVVNNLFKFYLIHSYLFFLLFANEIRVSVEVEFRVFLNDISCFSESSIL